MTVNLVWATPNGDQLLSRMARVSNPVNQDNHETAPKLISYLADHAHWSPFEMVNACVEIETTRDVSHQIIRHRSFSVQELSGRYSVVPELTGIGERCIGGVGEHWRELRMQDHKNRQHSVDCDDTELHETWRDVVSDVASVSKSSYDLLIKAGAAKEVVRALLPEGLTPSRLYMNGTLRSWIHYWQVRCTPETQKEHRLIAQQTARAVLPEFPLTAQAVVAHWNKTKTPVDLYGASDAEPISIQAKSTEDLSVSDV